MPAVVRWPAGFSGGRSIDTMMGDIDVYPTIKRITRVEEPDANLLDGRDMLDVMRGKAEAPKRDWFSYIAQGTADKTAICDGQWKLVVLGENVLDVTLEQAVRVDNSRTKPSVELFHLSKDPIESKSLVAEHPEIVSKLLERLKSFRRLKVSGVPSYQDGRRGFKAPKDWMISD